MIKDYFKKIFRGKQYDTLYLGLIKSLVIGIVLAISFYLLVSLSSEFYIRKYYLDENNSAARRNEYAEGLQSFIDENNLSSKDTDKIAEWASGRKYMYLMIYKDDKLFFSPDFSDVGNKNDNGANDGSENQGSTEGVNGIPSDSVGSGNNASGNTSGNQGSTEENEGLNNGADGNHPSFDDLNLPTREEIIADALANDMYDIVLSDGTLIAAVADYSETALYGTSMALAIALAVFVLTFTLVKYMRQVIKRIKLLEKDIKIVSRYDINHEIVTDGGDEIARLSDNAENMRRSILEILQKERAAVEANNNLVTSVSHDIRTPLTVLLGYIEMMKEETVSESMKTYIDATEKTAMRLKNLSDDMFKYLLAFGDAGESVTLEEYNAGTLIEQMLSEHILLLSESGYDIELDESRMKIPDSATVRTDAPNLMRIIDNIFSNLYKYADPESPINILLSSEGDKVIFECRNKIRTDNFLTESNRIGLKTCERLAVFVADSFTYGAEDDSFTARLTLKLSTANN